MKAKRIAVIGNSGAGKSTLAAEVARRLGLPFVATDPLYWETGWVPASAAVVRQRLGDVVAGDAWVIDGNCVPDRDLVWSRAEGIVWLDYALPLILGRVCRRNLRWMVTQEPGWSGNRMGLLRALSGIRHARRTYAQKRATYPGYLAEFPHLQIVRLHTSQELSQWIAQISEGTFVGTSA